MQEGNGIARKKQPHLCFSTIRRVAVDPDQCSVASVADWLKK